jgi:hypothetical protein
MSGVCSEPAKGFQTPHLANPAQSLHSPLTVSVPGSGSGSLLPEPGLPTASRSCRLETYREASQQKLIPPTWAAVLILFFNIGVP